MERATAAARQNAEAARMVAIVGHNSVYGQTVRDAGMEFPRNDKI